jgi:SAM-dependent methyltransferase
MAWNRLFKKPGRVLEVGCGQGFMLAVLKDLGWDVYGIERNEQAARVAANLADTDIFINGFLEVPDTARYELIILFQVLEHMEDPYTLLSECEKHLAPGGKIVISVPNFASWQAEIMGERWFHLDPPRHLFHFSPATLKCLLQRAGLVMKSISFVSWEHDPYGWLQSMFNRVGFPYNRLTKLLMRVEPFELGDLLFIPLVLGLGPISILLAGVSWIMSKGAIMTVIAEKSGNQ